MTLRTKTVASACATLALVWAASAQAAQARWTFHNETVGETITAPPGGTRAQTCADRLEATSGWGTFIDVTAGENPATFPIPVEATTAVDYQVWKAPPGFRNFDTAIADFETGEVYFEDLDGTRHQATLVTQATTAPRAALPTPLPASGNPNVSDNFVFTSAPISVSLIGVAPGDALALNPELTDGFVDVTAMDCSLPVIKGRVDVVPRSAANTVHPTNQDELVGTRIFGTPNLRVRRITTVHLGEAGPASVRPPRDANGDGRPDRLYLFRQGDTDMMCIDTHVRVTGRTSDHKRFQGRNPITTEGCRG
jgi:hypothetical protein